MCAIDSNLGRIQCDLSASCPVVHGLRLNSARKNGLAPVLSAGNVAPTSTVQIQTAFSMAIVGHVGREVPANLERSRVRGETN